MVIYGDYHTHTNYSHGSGTIFQNATVARDKGLKQIAICDHGYNHRLFAVKRNVSGSIDKEIELANNSLNIKVLRGIEANLISVEGDIDLNENELKQLDILIFSFHKMVKAKSNSDFFKLFVRNNFRLFKPSKRLINRNTLALIKAIEKYPVAIITHPGVGFPIDVIEVAKVAKKYGTFMEINGKRIAYKKEEIDKMVEMGVEFVLSSDAHSPLKVGDFTKCENFVLLHRIPENLIANLGKEPKFRKIEK